MLESSILCPRHMSCRSKENYGMLFESRGPLLLRTDDKIFHLFWGGINYECILDKLYYIVARFSGINKF